MTLLHSHSPITAQQTMATQVMNHVRDSIQNGTMATGQWYSVYQLSEKLKISRSPVREGLLRLEEAGLIEFVRNRGFQVVNPRAEDVADIFSLRLSLEPVIAARAARDRSSEQLESMKQILREMQNAGNLGDEPVFFEWDQQLHDLILESGNAIRARDILARVRTHTRLLSDSTVRQYRSMQQVQDEHLPIIDAIESKNESAAARAMENHLTATGKLLLRQTLLKQNSELQNNPAELENAVEDLWATYAQLI